MCLQCLCEPDYFNKKVGDFTLMRATKDPYENSTDGPEWAANEFGLVACNNPSLYFTTLPVPVKDDWLLVAKDIEDADYEDWWTASSTAETIYKELLSSVNSPRDILQLTKSAIGDISKFEEYDVSMAIMKVLYEAVESGFKTNAQVDAEIAKELEAQQETSTVIPYEST